MAAVSYRRSPATRTFIFIVLFFLSGSCFQVPEGGVASLSCQYSVERYGLSRACWGRGCGTFWCSNVLVQTNERGIVSEVSERYRLSGDVLDGQMDLDIVDVRHTDSGTYCCRVHRTVNDKRVVMNLRVVRALVTTSPTTTTTNPQTEAVPSTVHWKTQLEPVRRNSTHLHPPASTTINIPILSLSVVLLLTLLSLFFFMVFRRGSHSRVLTSSCFSSEEPPHIIYVIHMRRPLQENIYTLD